jgi:hypothetical protein
MNTIEQNPHVALNNARNLPRRSSAPEAARPPIHRLILNGREITFPTRPGNVGPARSILEKRAPDARREVSLFCRRNKKS